MHYRASPKNPVTSGVIVWKEVDEGWIRYDVHSGGTQLLAPLARFIIDLLNAGKPLSFSEMVAAVLHAEPEANRTDCEFEMEAMLKILSEHQLIEKVLP